MNCSCLLYTSPDFRRIADTIIDTAPGEFPGRGMPLGVEPSQQEMAAMPSAVDNWIKCQMSTHSAGHYMDDYCIILPDIEDLKKLGRAIVRQFEIRGIPVNKKKCKIIPLTKPFQMCIRDRRYLLHGNGAESVLCCSDSLRHNDVLHGSYAGCYRAAGSQRTRLRRWRGQHNSDENDHCAARNYPRQGCVCTGACIWQTCADL